MHEFQPVGKLVNLCFVFYTIAEVCLVNLILMAKKIKARSTIFYLVLNSL